MRPYRIERQPTLSAATELIRSAALPGSDLTHAHMEQFFFCGPAAAPTGVVGLELFGEAALLRSLAVAPDHRRGGLGSALVQQAETHACAEGAHSLFLLTTTAESFFSRRGFRSIPRDAAPASIRSTREFAALCPASAAFMVKEL